MVLCFGAADESTDQARDLSHERFGYVRPEAEHRRLRSKPASPIWCWGFKVLAPFEVIGQKAVQVLEIRK